VQIFHKTTAQVLATIILFAAVGAFAWGARRTLIAFLFAILFAYLLDPPVKFVQKSRVGSGSRTRAILVVYLALIGVLGIVFLVTGPKLVREGHTLVNSLPTLFDNLSTGQIARQIGTRRGWSGSTQERAAQLLASHRDAILKYAQEAGTRVAEVATQAVWLILIPILAIFFLRDGGQFANSVIDSMDRGSEKQLLRGIFQDLHEMLAAYIRAQLVLAGISLVVYTVVMAIMQVPYAYVLGVLGGLMEFIPVVGPLVAAAFILGVAFLSNYPHLLLLIAFLGGWRMVQDYVVSPRIMGGGVKLHPLAALFGVLVGAEIAGVLGVYLSIPIIATLRIIYRRWERYQQSQQQSGPEAAKTEDVRARKAEI
jgi:predicted PurR-regulated permease PerM